MTLCISHLRMHFKIITFAICNIALQKLKIFLASMMLNFPFALGEALMIFIAWLTQEYS